MRKRIRILVERPDRNHPGQFVTLYKNDLYSDDSVSFDYSLVLKALSCLYPYDDAIVSFGISF